MRIAGSFRVVKVQLYSNRIGPFTENKTTIIYNDDDDDLKSDQLQALTFA